METEDIKQEIARKGANPNSKRLLEGEAKARRHARRMYQEQYESAQPAWAGPVRNLAQMLLSIISTIFVGLLITVGVLGATLAVAWAEYEAVKVGFEVIDPPHAAGYSIAMVGFYITLLFIRELIVSRMKHSETYAFSMRLWWKNVLYFWGLERNWKPQIRQRDNLLVQIERAIVFLMWTVATFGVMGRLVQILEKYASDVPFVEGIKIIFTQATLADVLGIFGVGLMTISLLVSMHFIVYFVHNVFKKNVGEIDVIENFTGASLDEMEAAAARNYWSNLLVRLNNKMNYSEDSHNHEDDATP